MEIDKILPFEIKKVIHSPNERNISCWIGGSILSALGSFKRMWITKKVGLLEILLKDFRSGKKKVKSCYLCALFEISY